MKRILILLCFLAFAKASCLNNVFKCDDDPSQAARYYAYVYLVNPKENKRALFYFLINKQNASDYIARIIQPDSILQEFPNLGLSPQQLLTPFTFRLTNGAGLNGSIITSSNANDFIWLFSQWKQLIDFDFQTALTWDTKTPTPIKLPKYVELVFGKMVTVDAWYEVQEPTLNELKIDEKVECRQEGCGNDGFHYRIESSYTIDKSDYKLKKFESHTYMEEPKVPGWFESQRFICGFDNSEM